MPLNVDAGETMGSSLPFERARPRHGVMLVDGHALFRNGLKHLLREQMALSVVAEAHDAASALALAGTLMPELVIVDLGASVEALRLIETLARGAPGVSILVLTLSDSPMHVQAAMNAGAAGYALKDAAESEVLLAVQVVLAGGTFLSPGVTRRVREQRHQRTRNLSTREREVLDLLAQGFTKADIASSLSITHRTVDAHRINGRRKLKPSGRPEQLAHPFPTGITTT